MSNVCDACGWAAAFGGMLAFGTFGAPIKSDVARSVDIDPLVFQSYKTTMCFLTSWLILLTGTFVGRVRVLASMRLSNGMVCRVPCSDFLFASYVVVVVVVVVIFYY
jgi:hypothetical protein